MQLGTFIKSLVFKKVTKEGLISDAGYLNEAITNKTLAATNNVLSGLKSFKKPVKAHEEIINAFNRTHKPRTNKSIIAVLKTIKEDMSSISAMVPNLVVLIGDEFEDVTFVRSLTERQAALLRILAHINYANRYTMELLDYVVDTIFFEEYNGDDIPDKHREDIIAGLYDYIVILNTYRSVGEQLPFMLNQLADTILDTRSNKPQFSANTVIGGNVATTAGFIGSPFLSLGMFFAELQVEYYNHLKARKESIELKLLRLKSTSKSGETNPRLEHQIEVYENKILNLDTKIRAQEASVTDA